MSAQTLRSEVPTQIEALTLHARLLERDPLASADVADAYLNALAVFLIRVNPREDEHLCGEAAADAILALLKQPNTYQPDRGPLWPHLQWAAKRDLINKQQARQRRWNRQADLGALEPVLPGPGADPAEIVELKETVDERLRENPVPAGIRSGLSSQEAEVLALMRINERRTEMYARALGLTALPFVDQQRAIKRVKDRLKKRLERNGS